MSRGNKFVISQWRSKSCCKFSANSVVCNCACQKNVNCNIATLSTFSKRGAKGASCKLSGGKRVCCVVAKVALTRLLLFFTQFERSRLNTGCESVPTHFFQKPQRCLLVVVLFGFCDLRLSSSALEKTAQ